MKMISVFIALFLLVETPSAKEQLECFVGPVAYTLANQNWRVSSCSDRRSMVFVTREGNPAHPFVFIVQRSDEQSRIRGQGNAPQEHTSAALEALQELTEAQFDLIVEATRQPEAESDP